MSSARSKAGVEFYEKGRNALKKYAINGTNVALITAKTSKRNTSGVKGVTWYKPFNKWCARIRCAGTDYHLGYYDLLEDAIKARKLAEEKLFHPIIEEYEKENANA